MVDKPNAFRAKDLKACGGLQLLVSLLASRIQILHQQGGSVPAEQGEHQKLQER